MNHILNGPIERALAVAEMPVIKPAYTYSTTVVMVIAGLSLVAGASMVYLAIKKRHQPKSENAISG